jgi:hypothetical protein
MFAVADPVNVVPSNEIGVRSGRRLLVSHRHVAHSNLVLASRLHDGAEFGEPRRVDPELVGEVEVGDADAGECVGANRQRGSRLPPLGAELDVKLFRGHDVGLRNGGNRRRQ